MSIANKLTYLNQTKALIRQGINNICGELTENSTFRSYADELNKIVYTGEGTEVELNTKVEAKMKILGEGNTTQQTYEGYNLLNPILVNEGTNINTSNCNVTIEDDIFTFTATGSDMFFGNVIPSGNSYNKIYGYLMEIPNSGKIYVKCTNSDFDKNIVNFYDENQVSLGFSQVTSDGVLIPSTAKYCNVRIGKNASVSGTIYKTKIMVALSNVDYEPYVGGQASPNPLYPQSVKVVTGNNKVIVRTDNLVEESKITYYSTTNIYYPIIRVSEALNFLNGKYYTFSFNTENTGLEAYLNIPAALITIISGERYFTCNGERISITVLFNQDYTVGANVDLFSRNSPTSEVAIKFSKLMIANNNTSTPYVPYYRQELPLNLSSKNLFDKDSVASGFYNQLGEIGSSSNWKYIKRKIDNTKSIICSGINHESSTACFVVFDKNGDYLTYLGSYSQMAQNSYQIPSNAYYLGISCQIDDLDTLQVEYGTTATEYEEYYNYELCKIGDYQDEFILENDKWYIDKKINNQILNVDTTNLAGEAGEGYTGIYGSNIVNGRLGGSPIICDKLQFIQQQTNVKQNAIMTNAGTIIIVVLDNNLLTEPTLTGVKAYMSANSFKGYYILATLVREQIPNTTLISQLNAIYNAMSTMYKTYIETESEEENAQLIVSANCLRGEG